MVFRFRFDQISSLSCDCVKCNHGDLFIVTIACDRIKLRKSEALVWNNVSLTTCSNNNAFEQVYEQCATSIASNGRASVGIASL